MRDPDVRPRLRIAYSKDCDRLGLKRFQSDEAGPQASLFPRFRKGVLVFLMPSGIRDDEFLQVLEYARPAFIFDLRLAPRFDLGRLNRQMAFEAFEKVEARYYDVTSALMRGRDREDAWSVLRDVLSGPSVDFSRPIVFLLGQAGTSIGSEDDVLNLLANVGKRAEEVLRVPA
jgi:hypothetical protein